MADEGAGLAERLAMVRGRITDAAREAGRDPADIMTIVVTKFHPAALVRELYALGARDFGESRHQEAQPKVAGLADLSSGEDAATWHFIGQLQSKKAKQVREYMNVLHSVDRESLVAALAGPVARDVFIQVNLTADPERGGVAAADLDALADRVASADGLQLRGLMAVAPLGEEPRRAFATVRALSERLQRAVPTASGLSMGMSGDFREAILEGATHLRVGTAITGNRPVPG